MAEGAVYFLLTKADGWKLFCDRLGLPSFLLWKQYPGCDRLRHWLDIAGETPHAPEALLRVLERHGDGEPFEKKDLLTADGFARDAEKTYRVRVRWWGGPDPPPGIGADEP